MDTDALLQDALNKHREGDVAGAARVYGEILNADPQHPTANLNLASIAIDQGQVEEARGMIVAVLAQDEDNGVAHLLLSRVYFLLGKHEEGYPHINAAYEQLPEEPGVAGEFVAAMRRKYFTFEQGEYDLLFSQAQDGTILERDLQRLAHLTFLRIMRPELIKLIIEPGLPADTPDALSRWIQQLPDEAQSELAVLARNFAQAVEMMRDAPRFQPRPATLHMRKSDETSAGETRRCEALEDADTLTGPCIEIVRHGNLEFIPFEEIRTIEFHDPSSAMGAMVTLRDDNIASGLMPLFYLFTEFADDEKLRQGRSSLIRPILGPIAAGVGMRVLRVDNEPVPLVTVEKIEFED